MVELQDLAEETELRNRRSGQKVSQVAKQQVITLDSQGDILGLVALSSVRSCNSTNQNLLDFCNDQSASDLGLSVHIHMSRVVGDDAVSP